MTDSQFNSNNNRSLQVHQSFNRWFRWYGGTCGDGKFQIIAQQTGEPVSFVIAVWAILLEDASNLEHWGYCVTRNPDYYSFILGFDDHSPNGPFVRIVKAMETVGILTKDAEGFRIVNWRRRQYYTDARDPTHHARKAKWLKSQTGTQRNGVERFGTPDTDTDTDTDTDIDLYSSPKKKKRTIGTRLPKDWWPNSEDRTKAAEIGLNAPTINREAERFRDYWFARPSPGGVKLDWAATWRNWCRKVAEQNGTAPSVSGTPVSEDEFARLKAKYDAKIAGMA